MAESQIKQEEGESSHSIDKDDELEKEEEELKKEEERIRKKREELERKKEQKRKQSEQNDPCSTFSNLSTGIKEKEMLKKMEGKIQQKKEQHKGKQNEQNDPSSGFSNLDTVFKGVEDTVETDKQGLAKKAFIHQKDHLCMKIPYKKRKGTASTHGIEYEVKMAALIFLKLFNLGYSFYLCSNLDGAGNFDDIVVKYTTKEKTTETLFIQLKHAEKENTKRSLSLVKEAFFDLHEYFTTLCNSNLFTDPEHVIFSSVPSNVKYLIFTNADVKKSILCKANEVNSFLCGISMKGDILKICSYEDYEEFCNLIEKSIKHGGEQHDEQLKTEISNYRKTTKHKKFERILGLYNPETMEQWEEKYINISVSKFKNFISNTRILCNQKNVNDLDDLIKNEIGKVTISNNETEQVFIRLIDEMKNWFEKDSYYLTEKSRMWNSIMREASRSRERERELLNYGLRFKPEVVEEMQQSILQKYGVINIVCHNDVTTVTTLKVWQALNLCEQQDYILVSIKEYLENEQSILTIWPNWWCKTLVIDGMEDCVLSEQVIEKLKSEPEARLIIISSEKYSPQHCVINDNITLDQLDNESQEKLITKIINFQGQYVPLSSILERKHLMQLSGNALSHLIIDDNFILGENFDSYKNPQYIKRLIEIPYVSNTILDNNEKDTILAIEPKHEQSVLKKILNLTMSTQERLKIDNLENFRNCSISHKAKCDYAILSEGNEAEEFKLLCERFSNVHWIKECNEILHENKRHDTNIRNTSEDILLWKKSKGNIETIKKYNMSSNMYTIDEDRLITSDIESPVIITGEPGIGKSSLLKQMAASLKKVFPTKWVVFIDLPQYCKYLSEIENVRKNDVIEIIKMSVNLKNSLPIFDSASDNLDNFIILLDAFDEMSPDYTRKVKQFITFLVKLSSFMYITSRPCSVLELGSHISAIPYTVISLNNDEARKFFTKLLQEKNKEILEKKIKTSLTEVIAKPWSGQETFITNPLHVIMLAEIYNEKVKSEDVKILNILQLYTDFMKKKCEEFHKKTGADISHPSAKNELQLLIQRFLSFNKNMAAKQIFSNELHKKSNIEGVIPGGIEDTICPQIIKIGIADNVMNNNIKYTHRSYAEYFSALWLAENGSTNIAILKEVMQNKEMELIRHFYDLKCVEKIPLYTAVITSNEEEILIPLIEKGINMFCVDIMGRSALHLAAEYNNVKAVQLLINHIPDLYIVDNMTYTPLDYAAINYSWESMDMLFSNKFVSENEKKQIKIKFQHIQNELIFTFSAKGLQHLLVAFIENIDFNYKIQISGEKIFNKPEIYNLKHKGCLPQDLSIKTFPLLVAVEYNQHKLVRFLIENECYPWVKDLYGNTVLHIASEYGYTELVRYFMENSTCNKQYKSAKLHTIETHMDNSTQRFMKGGVIQHTKNKVFLSSAICTNNNTLWKCIHEIDFETLSCYTPLICAAIYGHIDAVKCLVENGFDLNYSNKQCRTALFYACELGYFTKESFYTDYHYMIYDSSADENTLYAAIISQKIDIVKYLVEKGCDINHSDQDGDTALFWASECGILIIVEYLVKKGCNKNHLNNYGCTALIRASMKGHTHIVTFLFDTGCSINQSDESGNNPLIYASKLGKLDTVKYLVENSCNINHKNNDGDNALIFAFKSGNIEIMKYLVKNGCNINQSNNVGDNALLYAAKSRNLDVMKYLVENRCIINHANHKGDNILLCACKYKTVDKKESLLDNGYNINHSNNKGDTALHSASKYGLLDIVKYAVEINCDINHSNNKGNNTLLLASKYGDLDVVKYLLEKGCKINHANRYGDSPLLLASKYNKFSIVQYLVEKGCNRDHSNNDGDNALHCASKYGNLDIFKYLLEKRSDKNSLNNNGDSALLLASKYGNLDVVKYLLEVGCNINHANNDGDHALLCASKSGKHVIMKYLVESGCSINHFNNAGDNALLCAYKYRTLIIERCFSQEEWNEIPSNNNKYRIKLWMANYGPRDIVKHSDESDCKNNYSNNIDSNDIEPAFVFIDEYGKLDKVKYLIENGCNINHSNNGGNTALHFESAYGDLDVVKYLLEKGCKINHANRYGDSPLLLESKYNKFSIVQYLVEKGCNRDHSNNEGDSALHCASKYGNIDIMKYLLEKGSDINGLNYNGDSALLLASKYGNLDVVKYLHEVGSKINHENNDGDTALFCASKSGNIDIMKYLLEKGSDINSLNYNGDSALLLASKYGNLDVVKYLHEVGCKINHENNDGDTALFCASKSGNIDIMKYLLEKGSDINSLNYNGDSALLLASKYGNLDVVKYLLEVGCKINHSNNDGDTALHCASKSGNIDIMKYLLEKGSDINSLNYNGDSALLLASKYGNLDVVKYLHEVGCKINHENNDGDTALFCASKPGNIDIMKYLLEKGSDINSLNYNGDSALLLASKYGNLDVVKYLLEVGCKINHSNNDGDTALHCASKSGNIDIMKYLLEKGSDINSLNYNGDSALLLASKYGNLDVVKYLLEVGCNLNHANNDGDTALHCAFKSGHLNIMKYLLEKEAT